MAKDHDVFMNEVTKDAKGIDLNVIDYGVSFGDDGVGGGNSGLGFEANKNEIIIDRELSEDNEDIFQVELDA
jgi:hypothetical protein